MHVSLSAGNVPRWWRAAFSDDNQPSRMQIRNTVNRANDYNLTAHAGSAERARMRSTTHPVVDINGGADSSPRGLLQHGNASNFLHSREIASRYLFLGEPSFPSEKCSKTAGKKIHISISRNNHRMINTSLSLSLSEFFLHDGARERESRHKSSFAVIAPGIYAKVVLCSSSKRID